MFICWFITGSGNSTAIGGLCRIFLALFFQRKKPQDR
jgi:hypothetical protein